MISGTILFSSESKEAYSQMLKDFPVNEDIVVKYIGRDGNVYILARFESKHFTPLFVISDDPLEVLEQCRTWRHYTLRLNVRPRLGLISNGLAPTLSVWEETDFDLN